MSSFDDDLPVEPGFFRRHRVAIGLGFLVLGGLVFAVTKFSGHSSSPHREAPITMVSLSLPPPPPPPPPLQIPPPQPQEQKMIDQTPVSEPEAKPEPPAPKDEPAPLGTNIKGDGSNDGFGVGSGGGNGMIGGTGNGRSGGGSKWGWYAGQVQSRIAEALRTNRKTRSAAMNVQVRVWPDSTGRVTRAQLAGTTGDRAVDEAIQNEILRGLQLQEPPPQGMPVPIVMRISARRPN